MLLCQFLVLAGNRQFFCCGVKVLLRPEKKSSSRLSDGLWCCVSFWFWQLRPEKKKLQSSVWRVVLLCQFLVLAEIGSFFVVAGKFYYDRKKKVPVVCLVGCAVVSVFGSGDYDWKKRF